MNKKAFLFAVISGLVFTSPALALTPEQIAQQQQQIIQQQQEQARQAEDQRRELQETERIRESRPSVQDTAGTDDKKASAADMDCSKFATIEVLGNKTYSARRIRKITDRYIALCVNRDNMAALQNELTALYIDSKYTLARIYFDQTRSKLTKGDSDIVFIVEEGIVNKIEFRDEYENEKYEEPTSWWRRSRNKTKRFTAAPFKGDVFNMKDFEQALDQLNRLQSNNATMDIKPTPGLNGAGHSDVHIINKHKSHRTTFFGAGVDNGGNKSTGENNWNLSLNQDNLLAMNDNIYLKYTHDTDFATNHHHSQSIYSAMSVPFGYWTFNSSLSWSNYLTTIEGMAVEFQTHGDTLTQTYGLDRVLYRSARYRTNLGTTLTVKDTASWIRDIKSIVGSRRASNVNMFWNNTIYHPWGTLIIKPSYQRGLGWFGSREDPADIYKTEPHLQYDMARLYFYSSMRFKIGIPITWNLTADGQYSFENLYAIDQQSLGGEYTVRGFRNSTISGDQGFYVRNDLRLPIWNLLPDFLTDWDFMKAGNNWSINSALGRTQISLFGDYGYVRNARKILPNPYDSNKGQMSGIGAGLHYGGKYLSWSLMYSYALASPEYLQTRDGIKKKEQSIYWRFTANY
jgi:hemolysin activation/secretion protein